MWTNCVCLAMKDFLVVRYIRMIIIRMKNKQFQILIAITDIISDVMVWEFE